MTTPLDYPPGPGFITRVVASAIHRAKGHDLAQLLITHPGPRRPNETVEEGMRRLATSLHLGPGDQQPCFIGARLMIRRRLVTLDYSHDQYVMTLPTPSQEWLALVGHGGLCRVSLVVAPLELGADQAEHDAHLTESLTRGLVMWGTTHTRGRF